MESPNDVSSEKPRPITLDSLIQIMDAYCGKQGIQHNPSGTALIIAEKHVYSYSCDLSQIINLHITLPQSYFFV